MIDEKKIEEAAEMQLEELGSYGLNEYEIGKVGSLTLYREEDVKESFRAGINWFLDNLWHDGEEMPKEKNKYILMYFGSYYVGEKELDHDEYFEIYHTGNGFCEDTWEEFCNEVGWCSKWLYVDNLLKGGE